METKKNKVEDGKVTTNIWQEILTEAMSKKDLDESHIFIFGDRLVGKHTLVKVINKELLQKNDHDDRKIANYDESDSKYSLVDFTSINVKRLNEADTGKYIISYI
jgi:predicted AAA+ superfamily ATPase